MTQRLPSLFLVTLFHSALWAQAGSLDLSFDPGTGTDFYIRRMALNADGTIVIAGNFTSYDGVDRYHIARVHADGSLDTSFDPGSEPNSGATGGPVQVVATRPDGKILIGGNFTAYNGVPRKYIAQINADGSLDTGFDPGTGTNYAVKAITLQPDGKILLGGLFTEYNDTVAYHIVRLHENGTIDGTFDPDEGANDEVDAITVQPDGKILVGGQFDHFDLSLRRGLVRLNPDGSQDPAFNIGTGASNEEIEAILLQPDGKIIIAGGFATFNGLGIPRVARLNADGSVDTTFDPGVSIGPLPQSGVDDAALQSDGKVILVGDFQTFNNQSRKGIVRLQPDGTLDTEFDPGIALTAFAGGCCGIGTGVLIQPDGRILVCGSFNEYNGVERDNIARVNQLDNTDVAEGSSELLMIAPNPTEGPIMISAPASPFQFALHDLAGREILNVGMIAHHGRVSLDLREHPAGVYAYVLRSGGRTIYGRLVKR